MKASIIFITYEIVVVLILFVCILKRGKYRRIQQENNYLEMQSNLLDQYYIVLKKQIEVTKKFRHDIANHIAVIERLARQGAHAEMNEYQRRLKQMYDDLKLTGYSNDPIIDALVRYKVKDCKNQGIEVKAKLMEFQKGEITERDLLNVFYSILNHIIQDLELSQPPDKYIHIESKVAAGNLFLWWSYPLNTSESRKQKRNLIRAQENLHYLRTILQRYNGNIEHKVKSNERIIHVKIHIQGGSKVAQNCNYG